ncbi:MAG: DUF975 family protein, partial [Lentisphaeria bacterium]|nr:DUF975 family protein [Lentisphaeria bacterium]
GDIHCEGHAYGSRTAGELCNLRLRRIGFVFQAYHLFPELSAHENVMLPALRWGWNRNRARDRAEELLRSFGLGERMRHRPQELSGGEQQRVALARALMNDPDILIADEPTGNLDVTASAEIVEILRRLHSEQGRTIIMVTHDLEFARLADVVLVVREGRVVAYPPDAEISLDAPPGSVHALRCPACDTDVGVPRPTPCPNCGGTLKQAVPTLPPKPARDDKRTSGELTAKAREALHGNWGRVVAGAIIMLAVMIAATTLTIMGVGFLFRTTLHFLSKLSSINPQVMGMIVAVATWIVTVVVWLVPLAVKGPMILGMCDGLLGVLRGASYRSSAPLRGFRHARQGAAVTILIVLKYLFWSLFLVVPGIRSLLDNSMAYFILAEHPSMRVRESMRRSSEMMYGRRWLLFKLLCRFAGWGVLSIATGGLAWFAVGPYLLTAMAAFYEDIRNR